MTTQSLSKSAITKEAQKLLNDGIPKQEAYETLAKKYNNSKLVADIMMHLPSSIAKSKYRKWNILLLISIIISGVMFFVYAPSPLLLFEFVFFVVVISIMYTKLYIWVSALSIISLLVFIGVVIASSLSTIYLPISISVFVLTLLTVFFHFGLRKSYAQNQNKQRKFTLTPTANKDKGLFMNLIINNHGDLKFLYIYILGILRA